MLYTLNMQFFMSNLFNKMLIKTHTIYIKNTLKHIKFYFIVSTQKNLCKGNMINQ